MKLKIEIDTQFIENPRYKEPRRSLEALLENILARIKEMQDVTDEDITWCNVQIGSWELTDGE